MPATSTAPGPQRPAGCDAHSRTSPQPWRPLLREQRVLRKRWLSVGCWLVAHGRDTMAPVPPPTQCDLSSGGSRTHSLTLSLGLARRLSIDLSWPAARALGATGQLQPGRLWPALGPSSSTVLGGLMVKLLTLSGKDGPRPVPSPMTFREP